MFLANIEGEYEMQQIKILDCTLRDGGYINNWRFGKNKISDIIRNLEKAKVDIIECGFIRDIKYVEDSSVFSSMKQLAQVIYPKKHGTLYAIMVEQHNFKCELIDDNNGDSADLIRLTFRRNEWVDARDTARILINKGYQVCIQPVGTAAYDDESLIALIKDVNSIKPYAFYLVDTLGIMYRNDVQRLFYLIDNNLSKDIILGFHSHNNLQMSFADAQKLIELASQRRLIIDTSCYGMGRGVGNLNTELFMDYINSSIAQKYSIMPVLRIIDKDLMSIYAEQRWGYDLPYFLSATVKCHPNYASHLLKKDTLSIDRIEKLLYLIPIDSRNEYNAELIERMYHDFQNCHVDDVHSIAVLKNEINKRKVLVLGAGYSLVCWNKKINRMIENFNLYTISTNFVSDLFKINALFISNEKRFSMISDEISKDKTLLITSNLNKDIKNPSAVFDYDSLLGEGDASDNAGAMLIRVLKKVGVEQLYLAGFDGFDVDADSNYYYSNYKKAMDYDTVTQKNSEISKQLKSALEGLNYELLTPTKYEI